MSNRAPFARIYRTYIKNHRKVYCETSSHHFSPDRHKHTQVQRGSTLGFDRRYRASYMRTGIISVLSPQPPLHVHAPQFYDISLPTTYPKLNITYPLPPHVQMD